MRNPIRSEGDAFLLALAGTALIAASVAVGAILAPLAGGALFACALIAALVWEVTSEDPDRRRPLREAAEAGRRGAPSAGGGCWSSPTARSRATSSRPACATRRFVRASCASSHRSSYRGCATSPRTSTRSRRGARAPRRRAGVGAVRGPAGQREGRRPDRGARRDRRRAAGVRSRRGADLDLSEGDVELARDQHRQAPARRAGHPGDHVVSAPDRARVAAPAQVV